MTSERRLSAIIEIGGRIAGSLGAAFRQAESNSQALNRRLRQNSEQRVELGRQIREAEDRLRRSTELTADEQERLNDLIRRARTEQERLNRSTERLRQLDNERTQRLQRHHELMGKIGKTVAMTAMAAVPLGMAFGKASEFDYNNVMIGNTADMSRQDTEALGQTTLMASRQTGKSAEETQQGLGFLVAAGMDVETAKNSIITVGRTATAAGAEIEDLAKAAFTLNDALGIAPKDLQDNLDTLAVAGKQGNVELKDIAKVIPVLGSGFVALKMKGREATATMGAMLEIARKGSATADEAANNMGNFIQKVASPDAIKKGLKEFNIDLGKVIINAQKKGKNPLEEAIKAISKATKGGDNILLGKWFADMQVQNFLRPMMQNYQEYERIKKEALSAKGVTDKDYEKVAETAKQTTAELRNELGRFGIVLGQAITPALINVMNTITPVIGKMTDWIAKNPELTSQIVMLGGALAATRISILAFKLAMNGLGILRIAGSIANLAGGMGLFGSVVRGGTTVLRLLGSTLGIVARGVLMLGTALLATPIGWVALAIAGIAAVGAAIYHWDDIKPYISQFTGWMGRTWDSTYKTVASGVSWCGDKIAQGWTWVADKTVQMGQTIKDRGIQAWEAYKVYFSTFWTTIGQTVDEKTGGMVTRFVQFGGEVYTAVSKGFENVKTYFTSFWADFETTAGKAIKWVTDKLQMIGDTWKTVKGYMGMAESAPVTTADGKTTNTQDFLAKNTGNIFPIIPNIKTTLDVNSPNAPKPQMANLNNSNNTSNDNRTINNNITVNQQPNQSPTALAREIATKLSGSQGVSNRGMMYDGAMGY